MGIGDDPVGIAMDGYGGWYREREWPGGEYSAGWMTEAEALVLIGQCAEDFHAGTV